MPKKTGPPSNIRKTIRWLLLGICTVAVLFGALKLLPIEQIAEKEISAELVITGLSDGLTATPPVTFVVARVIGPAEFVAALERTQLACTLDLTGLAPGVTSIPLAAEHFGLPGSLAITAIKPEAITFRIKTAGRKALPVYIAVAGKPAGGFTVIDTFAVPDKVTVAGPENLLAGMDRVMTKPIFIEGIAESIKKETALDLPAGTGTIGMEKAIVADIRIGTKTGRRLFSGIRVLARKTEHTAVFSPPEIILEIEGPENALSKLDRIADIAAYVDLAGLKPGVYARRASISLPLGITLVKARPEIFTVSVRPKEKQAQ